MNRLYSLGELLIDFQSVGTAPLKDTQQFVKHAGGAPANVCVQAVKLGQQATYLTKVGKDAFGDFLIQTLDKQGIETSYISQSTQHDTSLAFVSFLDNGEREFSFYRRACADLFFTPEDFKSVCFHSGDVFEFGSVALKTDIARQTHRWLIDKAKANNVLICFDPNLRFNLWENADELRAVVREFWQFANVIKVGYDELQFITAQDKPDISALWEQSSNLQVLLVTNGSKGAKVYTRNGVQFDCKGYKVKAVDTTGAGDSCFGAFIAGLMDANATPENLLNDCVDFNKVLDFACKCGAYTTTQFGAIPAMGDRKTVDKAVK